MASEANRQLLFGILAVQHGMIDQGQHTAAFQAYIRDQRRSLAEHLVSRGDLDAEQCRVVEGLVADHILKHGADVDEKSLSKVPAARPTLESLGKLGDEELTRILAHIPSASTHDDSDTEEGHRFFGGPNLSLVNLETGAFETIPLSAESFGSQARFLPSDGSLWAFHKSTKPNERAVEEECAARVWNLDKLEAEFARRGLSE